MFYIPIIGAFLEASGQTIEKNILRKHKINIKNYTVYGFLGIVLVMLPLIYFLWNLNPQALLLKNLTIFLLVVFISIIANILTFYALKRQDLCELEPVRLMQPLFTILIAFIFSFMFTVYSGERNHLILILALVASFSLIAAHIQKHHLTFNKYIIAALIGSFLFALELVLSREILDYYSPFTFYFLRCLLIFIITWIFFQPKLSSIPNKTRIYILIVSVIWVALRLILYYGYLILGIVFTTMLFILSPVLVYIFAGIFLKEKVSLRQVIASIIIIICVVIGVVFGS